MQTQTSNTLHNVIMEAGSKDPPPMLAPDKEVQISEGSHVTRTETYMETYKNVSQDIRDQLNAKAKAVQIILTGIDNAIYSTVDACSNACEMWKAIERAERIARIANPLALVAQQQPVYNPQNHPTHYTQNSSTISQQATTSNRGKAIVNSPQPIYDQEPFMVAEDDETSRDNEIDKLMALISLSFKKIYKPTNNNLRTSSNTSRANQDNSPRINRSTRYENQRIGNVAGARETVEQSKSVHDTCPIEQEEHNVIIDSLDMSYDSEQIDENDDDNDLANERELLASLIEKLKCEIDDNKNRNKFLETSKKVLIEKLKESSNNRFKEANNKLSETNNLLYNDFKRSQAELARRNDVEPQLKRNPMEDRVMLNNSKGKKQEVEDQGRNVKLSKNKTSVTVCNDSLNAKTLNVNFVSATCGKCVLNDKHDMCVLNSVAKPIKKTIASESNQKPRNITRKLYERVRTVKFGNDQITPILGYGDLLQGAVMIKWVYYVEGLNHNLFSVGQFCDADLEVAFRKSTCYIRDLKGNDLLTGSRGTDLYLITLQETTSPNPVCLMAKATSSQEWLWHRRLSHLNFDTINLLLKNDIMVGLPKLKFVKDHLCSSYLFGPMRVASINGKRYVLVIVDDYSRYTWTHFLRSKDETLKFSLISSSLSKEDFMLKRNRTLVEAARTMLSAAKVPLFFWAETIATTCFTQNCSLVIPRHEKTPYHIINDRKPSVKFFHIFGSLCYIVGDGESLDKIKEKGDACIFVGYSTQSRAYRVFNKRTRVITETIHVNFDELPQMASDHVSSDLGPECQRMALEHDSLSPGPQCQENVTQADRTVTTSNELVLLFSSMFAELLNGSF
nr:hypothetical protein [Tanacetum cinerariifolium]